MALLEIQWKPTSRQLRQFGIICMFALPFITWLWGGSLSTVGILAAIGVGLAVIGLVAPVLLKPLFIALTLITLPIGLVVGEIAMAFIYFGMILPFGIVFRLVGRDALQLKRDKMETHWRPKKQPKDMASYFHQS
jgi:hypothetical protein